MIDSLRLIFVLAAQRRCYRRKRGIETLQNILLFRNGDFGRYGRSSRADIGGKIAKRVIGFMTDRRNDRNGRRRDRTDKTLVVEAEQIFKTSAAARDDDDVRLKIG